MFLFELPAWFVVDSSLSGIAKLGCRGASRAILSAVSLSRFGFLCGNALSPALVSCAGCNAFCLFLCTFLSLLFALCASPELLEIVFIDDFSGALDPAVRLLGGPLSILSSCAGRFFPIRRLTAFVLGFPFKIILVESGAWFRRRVGDLVGVGITTDRSRRPCCPISDIWDIGKDTRIALCWLFGW